MKILICGKGGSGKSTITTLLSKKLKNRGYEVLLVDADESNFGLHRLAGVASPQYIMENLGGKKGFKQKLNATFPTNDRPFSKKIRINELPPDCVSESDGIKLAVIGKIHDFGEGCACPMGMLSKLVLSNLLINENEIVLVDTEAGVEHFGRRVDAECDLILGIIDPTFESFLLSKKIEEMAVNADTDAFFILNKVDDNVSKTMQENINMEKVIAQIPNNEQVFLDSLNGNTLSADISEIDPICQLIQDRKTG